MAGVPIFKVSKWLGHSTIELTVNTYGHLVPQPDEHDAVDALDTAGHNLVTPGNG
jgi:hypothetical protein